MGAWGAGSFDNDPAMDLLVQYEGARVMDVIARLEGKAQ